MKALPLDSLQKKGWAAQKKLAPSYRHTPPDLKAIKSQNPLQAAVLCLWIQRSGTWQFPLIKRTAYPGVHSGQISFPGGKYENSDGNLFHTACRETEEELGISLGRSLAYFELSELYIPPSNFLVHPYMAVVEQDFYFQKETKEVAKILLVSQQELENSPIKTYKEKKQCIPYFEWGGERVWGATAMILNEIKEILQDAPTLPN